MDKGFVLKQLGIIGQLAADYALGRLGLIADKGIGIQQIFKHDVRAGFHSNAVHFLLLLQLPLQAFPRGNIHHCPLHHGASFRSKAHNHGGAVQPVNRSVRPQGAVFPVLAVAHLMEQPVGLLKHFPIFFQHVAQNAVFPVFETFFHALIAQEGEGCTVEGDQFAVIAVVVHKTKNAAGYRVIDTGKQLRLDFQPLGVLLGAGNIQVQAVDHPAAL